LSGFFSHKKQSLSYFVVNSSIAKKNLLIYNSATKNVAHSAAIYIPNLVRESVMSNDGVNQSRRKFLLGATGVVGGAGIVGAAVPFVASWQPSAKAKAAGAPVKVNIAQLEAGGRLVVEWRGKPVYIVRRTQESLEAIEGIDAASLKDADSASATQPAYVSGNARSLQGKEDILVLVGLCTHLGCAPMYRPDVGAADLGGDAWLGGFFCPCHGSTFDMSGRVFAGVPAPTNLEIPPHSYESDDVLVIGIDSEVA
jgi:ubiquinol-cytochrome c reductase iron-sulfur subunit